MGYLRDLLGGPRRPRPSDYGGERVFYSAADMTVIGTESELREVASMARLEGTGKDPEGRYGKGVIFDVPAWDPQYDELIEKGWAKTVAPEDDPGRSRVQIANAIVRNDLLSNPVEAAIADEIGEADAYGITHTGDPGATWEDANPEPGSGAVLKGFGEMEADMTADDLKAYRKAAAGREGRASEKAREEVKAREAARAETTETKSGEKGAKS
jgi:hypothetical protein